MFKFKKYMETNSKSLIIVESPSKIKTLKKFLGNEFIVEASVGHIRDLAKKDLGVDIENNFTPTYIVSEDKTKVVQQLKKAAKGVNKIFLATDPDREGEAISWHILETLKPKTLRPKKLRIIFPEKYSQSQHFTWNTTYTSTRAKLFFFILQKGC